ncbi:hypothetical protein B296_00027265 [Ensete ventricosum]|uniref:Uncharacterized protein n=1 Tax=Ensete ventricosum TaxID=4639 RepID=A0A426XWR1_ENSVE|nr:hypothetical protein B296_00027265 [Ensete ventricosum]
MPSARATALATSAVTLSWHLTGERHRLARALPLLAATPASDCPCRRQPWPRLLAAALAWGLAVASHPFSSLLSLQKRSKNA